MKGSYRLGRLLGVDVNVHWTFLLLLVVMAGAHLIAGRSVAAALDGMLFLLGLFACVLLHEYGHALAARRYGIGTRDITLLPIGGLARLERMPDKPSQELVVALAGPLVNGIIAFGLFLGLLAYSASQPLGNLLSLSTTLAGQLLVANVFLILFNLLPAFPMDGGRVLRALLALRMDYVRATTIAARIGQGMAFVFGVVGLFTNPFLLLIAVFVWFGAGQEAAAASMRASLGGTTVREAMLTDFDTLEASDTLGKAATLTLRGSQAEFPVLNEGRLLGVLSQADLLAGLREHGETSPVVTVLPRESSLIAPNAPLDQVVGSELIGLSGAIAVQEDGRLVGLLTLENIRELVLIRSSLANRPPEARFPSRRLVLPPVIASRPPRTVSA